MRSQSIRPFPLFVILVFILFASVLMGAAVAAYSRPSGCAGLSMFEVHQIRSAAKPDQSK